MLEHEHKSMKIDASMRKKVRKRKTERERENILKKE